MMQILRALLQIGQAQETKTYDAEIDRLQTEYNLLKRQRLTAGNSAPPELVREFERIGRFLDATKRDLAGAFDPVTDR